MSASSKRVRKSGIKYLNKFADQMFWPMVKLGFYTQDGLPDRKIDFLSIYGQDNLKASICNKGKFYLILKNNMISMDDLALKLGLSRYYP